MIWKNSLFLFFSQIIRLTTNIFIGVGIARLYGPEFFGQFSIAYTIAILCVVIADFGFDVLLTSEIAKNRDNAVATAKKYFSMKIIFAGISFLIMIAIPSFQTFSQNSRILIYPLTLFVVFTTLTNFFYAIFRGFEKFEYETKISFISNLALLILLGIFGFLKIPLVFLVMSFVVARLIGVILCIIRTTSMLGSAIIAIDFKDWKFIIKQIIIFGLHFIFGNLFFQLDSVLVGLWKGDHAAGIYRSAFNIMVLVLLLPDIAISTVLPILSRFFADNIEKWKSISRLLYKILFVTALPITLILFFYSKQIIAIVYGGTEFNEAIPLLKIFSLIVLVRFMVEPFALMITTSNRQYIRMIIVVLATILSLSLNYFYIPVYGVYGAAWIALGVNVAVGIGYIFVNSFYFFKWTFEGRTITILVLACLFFVLFWCFNANFILLVVSLLIYPSACFYIGFSVEERQVIFTKYFLKGG